MICSSVPISLKDLAPKMHKLESGVLELCFPNGDEFLFYDPNDMAFKISEWLDKSVIQYRRGFGGMLPQTSIAALNINGHIKVSFWQSILCQLVILLFPS